MESAESLKRKFADEIVEVDEEDTTGSDRLAGCRHTHESEDRKAPRTDGLSRSQSDRRALAAQDPHASDPSGSSQSNLCHRFSQSGKCKFGDQCRFVHAEAPHLLNPDRFTKYDISQADEDQLSPQSNKTAAFEAIRLAREARLAREGAPVPKDEPKHVIGQKIIFTRKHKKAAPSPSPSTSSTEKQTPGSDSAAPSASSAVVRPKANQASNSKICLANQLFDEEEPED